MSLANQIQKEEKPSTSIVQTTTCDWLNETNHNILLYGPSKVGKTYAYCSIIENAYKNGNKTFVVSTDKGFRDTFIAYFGDKANEVAKFVEYMFVPVMDKMHDSMGRLLVTVKANDWLIVDLISDFWEMAQDKFIEDASGGDPSSYIIRAAKDSKKFGLFAGQMWQYIKQLDDTIVNALVLKANCNVLAVAAEKDLEIEKAISGKLSETSKHFDDIGSKPAGQKRLGYKFNNIVYIGKEKGQHYFRIVGARGQEIDNSKKVYQKSFWEKYKEVKNVRNIN